MSEIKVGSPVWVSCHRGYDQTITRTPIRKKRAGGPRRGRIVDKPYMDWLHLQPCLLSTLDNSHVCNGPLTVHHVRQNAAMKDDTNAVPLCYGAHLHDGSTASVHRLGSEKFQAFWGVSFADSVQQYWAKYFLETGIRLAGVDA